MYFMEVNRLSRDSRTSAIQANLLIMYDSLCSFLLT